MTKFVNVERNILLAAIVVALLILLSEQIRAEDTTAEKPALDNRVFNNARLQSDVPEKTTPLTNCHGNEALLDKNCNPDLLTDEQQIRIIELETFIEVDSLSDEAKKMFAEDRIQDADAPTNITKLQKPKKNNNKKLNFKAPKVARQIVSSVIVQQVVVPNNHWSKLNVSQYNTDAERAALMSSLNKPFIARAALINRPIVLDNSGKPDYQHVDEPPLYASFPVNEDRMLRRGSFINMITLNRINSEIAGQIIAIVNRNVYSKNGLILIPAGSRVTGNYQQIENVGEARIKAYINEIVTPNGVRVKFAAWLQGGALATNDAGVAGLGGMLKGMDSTGNADISTQVLTVIQEVTKSIVSDRIKITPTLTLPAGSHISMIVPENIFFKPPTQHKYVDAYRASSRSIIRARK